jgi:DNA-binding MarR family transcriptional regulator
MNRGRRWQLQDAIEQSGLPHRVRHVLQALLHRADARTGIIPAGRMPTITDLVNATGLRRQDVGEALTYAVAKGWLRRERGGGPGNPTRYTVLLPSECVPAGGTQ